MFQLKAVCSNDTSHPFYCNLLHSERVGCLGSKYVIHDDTFYFIFSLWHVQTKCSGTRGYNFFCFVRTINNIEPVFLCGEHSAFFKHESNLLKALVNLIVAYYVKYPQCMIGVLLFLQEVVLLPKLTQFKGAKYAFLMAQFAHSRRRNWEMLMMHIVCLQFS